MKYSEGCKKLGLLGNFKFGIEIEAYKIKKSLKALFYFTVMLIVYFFFSCI